MEENIPKLSEEKAKKKSLLLPVLLILLVLLVGILAYIVLKQKSEIERLQKTQETSCVVKEVEKKDEQEDKKENDEADKINKEETIVTKEYVLSNPKMRFNYPSNYTVSSSTESKFVIVKISADDSYLEIKVFEAVGGPGGPTAYEITNLGSLKIGEVLGNNLYRVQTESTSYIYTGQPTKCVKKTECDIYEPKCACKNIDNYIVNSMLPADLTWSPSENGTTYISFTIKGNPSQTDLNNYDDLLLSLKSN